MKRVMKLYRFQSGTIITKKHLLVSGPVSDEPYEVPVPFYLIDHPKGKVLFDTGQPYSAISGPKSGDYIPVMSGEHYVSNQLKRHGLKTTDITYIVLSHLHSDHAGGLEAFCDTECFVNEAELQNVGKTFFEEHPLKWKLLKEDYDIFGDGKVVIVFTPGHTPGHQSLLVTLDEGKILLAADSVYTDEILDHNVLPGVFNNKEDTIETLNKIKGMRNEGIKIVSGHPYDGGEPPLASSASNFANKFAAETGK